jgi:hypothetical protein
MSVVVSQILNRIGAIPKGSRPISNWTDAIPSENGCNPERDEPDLERERHDPEWERRESRTEATRSRMGFYLIREARYSTQFRDIKRLAVCIARLKSF